MFGNDPGLEECRHPVTNGPNRTVVDAPEIAEVYIQIYFPKLRPGMHRKVALAETDYPGKASRFEIVIHFSKLLQLECTDECVSEVFKTAILVKQCRFFRLQG